MSALSLGHRHACVITESDGALTCWGDDSDGQIAPPAGFTTAIAVAAGGTFTCALGPAGRPVCWGALDGDPPANLTLTTLAAGYAHACGLDADGRVTCWGDDTYAQVSDTPDVAFAALFAGGWTTCGLLADGGDAELGYRAHCWGDDAFGQVGDAPPYTRFLSLTLGDEHVCGLKPDGLLSCWGSDRVGQLDWPLPNEI